MTSKNSFLASIKEDNKRRLWLWLSGAFLFVIFAPLLFLVLIAGIDEQYYLVNYGDLAQKMIQQAAGGICEVMLGVNFFRLFIGGVFGVLAAYSGFFWLDDKIRVDFYASMPEKKNRRFFVSVIGTFAMYSILSIIGLILSHAILGAFGYGGAYSAAKTCHSFIMSLLFFAGIYFICVLAISLTGNVFASVCAIAVLSLYEFLIRCIWIAYSEFQRYTYHLETDFVPVLTPWGSFVRAIMKELSTGSVPASSYLMIICLTILVALFSYLAYMYRPMEAAGKTLAFKKMATCLKFLLAIPAAVSIGLTAIILSESESNRYLLVVILVVIISAIIACAVIEAIFELDVKAILSKKLHWIITAVAAVIVFFVLKEDAFGLDRYIPDRDNIESVAIAPDNFLDSYMFLSENMGHMSAQQYCIENMFITDIDSIYELMELSMKSYDEDCLKTNNRDVLNYMRYTKYDDAVIVLRTKNGRVIYKNIPVPLNNERAQEIEKKIFSSDEFINGYFCLKKYDFTDKIPEEGWHEFSNNYTSITLNAEETENLLECYKQDLDEFDYEKICNEGPLGTVYFSVSESNFGLYNYMRSSSFSIYPSMKNCVDCLESIGYKQPQIDAKDIASISITYYEDSDVDYDDIEKYYYSMTSSAKPVEPKSVVYVSEDDIEKLFPYISMNEYSHKWGQDDTFETAYNVEAEVNTAKLYEGNDRVVATNVRGNTIVYFNFLKDQVPDFVKKDLGIE
ncbi:MAG: hypothetical protein IKQ44_01965 [Lachnospiraceae bacterium]|nr:hypothetical protein [Lachnospiraceae bacterium]